MLKFFREIKLGHILLTGPIISIGSYNLIALIYRQSFSSVKPLGHLVLVVLAFIPFLIPFYFSVTSEDIVEPEKSERRRVQTKVTYTVATLLSLTIYFLSAYAEEGPYTGGGAAMSILAILFYGMPGTTALTFIAGIVTGLLAKPKHPTG